MQQSQLYARLLFVRFMHPLFWYARDNAHYYTIIYSTRNHKMLKKFTFRAVV